MFSRLQVLIQHKQQPILSPLEIKGDIFVNKTKRRAFSEENDSLALENYSQKQDETSTMGSSSVMLTEFMQELVKLPEFEDEDIKNIKISV
ncbi:UNKNOWN [Stylonychia lemnae]|uniref:Uncharacterized protein n=1 Tax=Stylonychia lemnae TaxID=5949 RepID=A0A078AD54_STYLE|nr:UNKNOWN [Stylonychia lemnae]|eukprot:CDW80169.1 UNKNOWN [Stylonychia lemnae]